MTAFISLDGVLRTEVGDPIHEGLKLFRTMVGSYRIALATDGKSEEAEYWLRANLITGYAEIYDNRVAFEGQDLRLRQLSLARASGRIELFIDCDVDRCASAIASGVATMLFAKPGFTRRKREPRPWQEVKQEIEYQQNLKAKLTLDSDPNRWE